MKSKQLVDKALLDEIRTWKKLFSFDSSIIKNKEKIASLLNNWNNTLIAANTAYKGGEDKFFLDMEKFLKEAMKFFKVTNYDDLPKTKPQLIKKIFDLSQREVLDNVDLREGVARYDLNIISQEIVEEEKIKSELDARKSSASQQLDSYFVQEENKFTSALQEKIINVLDSAIGNSTDKNEIAIANSTKEKINNIIKSYQKATYKDYRTLRDHFVNEHAEGNIRPDEFKKNYVHLSRQKLDCINAIKKMVRTNLIENPDLVGSPKAYAIKIGKVILNGLLLIPLGIPSVVKYLATGTPLFSLKTDVEKKGEEIISSSEEISKEIAPKRK